MNNISKQITDEGPEEDLSQSRLEGLSVDLDQIKRDIGSFERGSLDANSSSIARRRNNFKIKLRVAAKRESLNISPESLSPRRKDDASLSPLRKKGLPPPASINLSLVEESHREREGHPLSPIKNEPKKIGYTTFRSRFRQRV